MNTTVRIKVCIGGIQEGSPPRLLFHKIITRPDGKRRPFSMSAAITEPELLALVRREAANGAEAEVVVEQQFSGSGIFALLKEFVLLHSEIRDVPRRAKIETEAA